MPLKSTCTWKYVHTARATGEMANVQTVNASPAQDLHRSRAFGPLRRSRTAAQSRGSGDLRAVVDVFRGSPEVQQGQRDTWKRVHAQVLGNAMMYIHSATTKARGAMPAPTILHVFLVRHPHYIEILRQCYIELDCYLIIVPLSLGLRLSLENSPSGVPYTLRQSYYCCS